MLGPCGEHMQIHEITGRSALGENIDFFKGLASGITNKLGVSIPDAPVKSIGQAFVDPNRQQAATAKAMQQQVGALSQKLANLWMQAAYDVMAKTQDRTTGRMGVKSIRSVDQNKLRRMIDGQINRVLEQITRGRVTDFRKLEQAVDPQAYQGKGQQAAQAVSQQIERAIQAVLAVEPDTKNPARMNQAWNEVARRAFEGANMAMYAGQAATTSGQPTVAVNSAGHLTLNGQVMSVGGQPLLASSPQAQQIIQTLQQQGRVP